MNVSKPQFLLQNNSCYRHFNFFFFYWFLYILCICLLYNYVGMSYLLRKSETRHILVCMNCMNYLFLILVLVNLYEVYLSSSFSSSEFRCLKGLQTNHAHWQFGTKTTSYKKALNCLLIVLFRFWKFVKKDLFKIFNFLVCHICFHGVGQF